MADNYVEILVKSRDQAKPDLTDLKARLEDLSKTVATARANVDDADAAAKLDMMAAKLADLSKKTANPKITVSGAVRAEAAIHAVEASLNHLGDDSAGSAGDNAGRSFMSSFAGWLKPSKFQLITSALVSGLAMLPALGAVAGVAIAGALAIGIASQNKQVGAQIKALGSTALTTLENAVKPILPVIRSLLSQVSEFVKSMGPEFSQLFKAVGPMLQPFVQGLEQLVANLLPGFVSLVKAAQPAITAFSGILSSLGSNLGSMFADFGRAVGPASKAMSAILGLINTLLPVVATLAGAFAKSLAPVLVSFGNAIHALAPAIGEIGVILGKLAGAVLQSLSGALSAIAGLLAAVAPGFATLAQVLGQVFSLMENSGVFGVLEDTLEAIAKPLGALITALVGGLAPVLSVLIGAVARVSAALVAGLGHALIAILPALTQLAVALGKMLIALTPLIGPLVQLNLSLIKILVALTPLLPPLVQIITLIVELATKALAPLVSILVVAAQNLNQLANITAVVIAWVAKAIGKFLEWVESGSKVTAWFGAIGGKIKNALASAGQWLFNAGRNIIEGLLHGIESMAGSLISRVQGLASDVTGAFSKVLGIFSPSKVFDAHGANIVQGAINGINRMRPALLAAMKSAGLSVMPSGISVGAAGSPALAGAGGGSGDWVEARLELKPTGNRFLDELMEEAKLWIRRRGGGGKDSVQRALGENH